MDTADDATTPAVKDANARGEEPRHYVITNTASLTEGGAVSKLRDNLAALELLKKLEGENRMASGEEQAILARYIGWGHTDLAGVVDPRGVDAIQDPRKREARQALDRLLTPDQVRELGESTINAHYSFSDLPRAMWEAVQQFGFKGGTVLEPAVGTGHFFGTMPTSIVGHPRTRLFGVDKEPIAAAIAKQLYQSAYIQPTPLQHATLPTNYLDVAISNVPFGKVQIFDPAFTSPERSVMTANLHNYFFAKALDAVRPGGLVAFVTSRYTMDSKADTARRYLAARADLIGAIRLPQEAFRKTAGTDVVTDVLFLQKRPDGAQPSGQAWTNTVAHPSLFGTVTNEYFHAHPEMILGKEALTGKMNRARGGAFGYNVEGNVSLDQLRAAIANLPRDLYKPAATAPRKLAKDAAVSAETKQGSYVLDGGKLYHLDKGTLTPSTLTGTSLDKVKAFIPMRDAYDRVLDALTSNASDADLQKAQQGLKKAYESFVKAYGPVNKPNNRRLIEDDPNGARVLGLEEVAKVKKPGLTRTELTVVGLADIFDKRVTKPSTEPTSSSSPQEALLQSLAWKGQVDLDYMASLLGTPPEEIAQTLAGQIYQDPVSNLYVTKDAYLAGDVVTKLAQAQARAAVDPEFANHVAALTVVQPKKLEVGEFDAPFGSTWIPVHTYEAFLKDVGHTPTAVRLLNTAARTEFYVEATGGRHEFMPHGADYAEWVADALNGRLPTISDTLKDGSKLKNAAKTEQYRESLQQLREEWGQWWQSQHGVATELTDIYNAMFNREVARQYDGTHLVVPGMSPEIKLRPWQSNVAWRAVQNGNTLIDHAMGSGKTISLTVISRLMKHFGIANKPMITVPNPLIEQWKRDYLAVFPTARILVPTEEDFQASNRRRFVARIANNEWDVVILPHSQFNMVGVKPEALQAFVKEQEDILLAEGAQQLGLDLEDFTDKVAREQEKKKGDKSEFPQRTTPQSVKDIVRSILRLRARLQKRLDQSKKDAPIYFEDLGVDALLIDESHLFKNLYFSTAKNGIAGLRPSDADRAMDMYLKARHINNLSNSRNLVFATGTPISNAMSEVFTAFRYLAQPELDRLGMAGFDGWANSFAVASAKMERAPGGGYTERTRLRDWANLHELSGLFRKFTDVVSDDDIRKSGVIKVPTIVGGGRKLIATPARPEYDEFNEELKRRIEAIRSGDPLTENDNYLVVTTDAGKAAIDIRLVKPELPEDPNGRIPTAAKEIAKIYKDTADHKATQLVFLDIGVPKKLEPLPDRVLYGAPADAEEPVVVPDVEDEDEAGDEDLATQEAMDETFLDLYSDLKRHLVKHGVKPDEIAFIHQARNPYERLRLFDAVNQGRVRVLVSTRSKGGVGVNVQKRAIALHHIDVPWRPDQMSQAEARIIRPGNSHDEVSILGYVTKGSFDEYRWGVLTEKRAFVTNFEKGAVNRFNDEDPTQIDYETAAALASGDPRVMEATNLEREVRSLASRAANFARTKDARTRELASDKGLMVGTQAAIDDLAASIERGKLWSEHPTVSMMSETGRYGLVRRQTPVEMDWSTPEARAVVRAALGDLVVKNGTTLYREEPIATAGPFELVLSPVTRHEIQVVNGITRSTEEHGATVAVRVGRLMIGALEDWYEGAAPDYQYLGNLLSVKKLEAMRDRYEESISDIKARVAANEEIVAKTFPQEKELKAKQRRLRDLRVALGMEKLDPVEQMADNLMAASNEYHEGRISIEDMHARQQQVWKRAEDTGTTEKLRKAVQTRTSAMQTEGSGGLQSAVVPGAREFYEQDVVPTVKAAVRDVNEARMDIIGLFAPASASITARDASLSLRAVIAARDQKTARAQRSTEHLWKAFDRALRDAKTEAQKAEVLLAFVDPIETGKIGSLPPDQVEAARVLGRLLQGRRDRIDTLGGTTAWMTHYFPHEWADPSAARNLVRRLFGKRPFQGPKAFLKQRTIPTTRQGIESGHIPISYNPVELVLRKLFEMDKFISATEVLKDWSRRGIAVYVPVGVEPPLGFQRLDHSFATVYGKPTVTVQEAFDPKIIEGVYKLLQDLGVSHKRLARLGRRWGEAEGDVEVRTRFAGPEGVEFHELGHILDERYGLRAKWGLNRSPFSAASKADPKTQEFRALADLRDEGQDRTKSRMRYVRKGEEKIANAFHAYLYMPDRMQEVAPNVYKAIQDLIAERPELKPLDEIQKGRSLRLGTATAEIPVGGAVIRGYYYAPPDVVRLMNNHLAPGLRQSAVFNLYRRLGNSLNMAQLGWSAYHVLATANESIVSKSAIWLEHFSRGNFEEGLKALLQVPLAPLFDFVNGRMIVKQFYDRDASSGELSDLLSQIVQAGGGFTWSRFEHDDAPSKFMQALRQGNYPGAALRSIPALIELTTNLIMTHWVPYLKAAAFADRARMEMATLGEKPNLDEARRVLGAAWDSIENRFGQVRYDNWFWHTAMKDMLMATLRAVGWTAGEIAETLGSVPKQLQRVGLLPGGGAYGNKMFERPVRRVNTGTDTEGRPIYHDQPEPMLDPKLAWVVSVIMVSSLIGSIIHYLRTGQAPRILKDLFYPGEGKDRWSIPGYFKDWYAFGDDPVAAAEHKVNPAANTLFQMLSNEDFYGTEIRNEDDPKVQQLKDLTEYLLKQWQPISVSSTVQNLSEGKSPELLANFLGVNRAPASVTRTDAEKLLQRYQPFTGHTKLQAAQAQVKRQVRAGTQTGESARQSLSKSQVAAAERQAKMSYLQNGVQRLTLTQALNVYDVATPEERGELYAILSTKAAKVADAPRADQAYLRQRIAKMRTLPRTTVH